MKKLIILLHCLISMVSHASEQPVVAWGASARANGKGGLVDSKLTNERQFMFYQEDTFIHAHVRNGDFFGVFDGHGQPVDPRRACDILRDNLTEQFAAAAQMQKTKNKIFNAFVQVEKMATEFSQYQGGFNHSGAMAVAVYVKKNSIHVAHAGDSRAIFFGYNKISHETSDHKCTRPDEFERIKSVYKENLEKHYRTTNSRGQASAPRVNGLQTSRSIGDAYAKLMTKANRKGDGAILGVPEYSKIRLTNNTCFTVIATDGLWDVMTSAQVQQFVIAQINKPLETLRKEYSHNKPVVRSSINTTIEDLIEECCGEQSRDDEKCLLIARALRDEAVKRGSTDNICVVVADLLAQKKSAYQLFSAWINTLPPFSKGILCTTGLSLLALVGAIIYKQLH